MSSEFVRADRITRAVGLAFDYRDQGAPTISVRGDSLVAKRIIELARRYNVPVVNRPDLVSSLSLFELDQQIPESLFEPIALLLHQIKRRAT